MLPTRNIQANLGPLSLSWLSVLHPDVWIWIIFPQEIQPLLSSSLPLSLVCMLSCLSLPLCVSLNAVLFILCVCMACPLYSGEEIVSIRFFLSVNKMQEHSNQAIGAFITLRIGTTQWPRINYKSVKAHSQLLLCHVRLLYLCSMLECWSLSTYLLMGCVQCDTQRSLWDCNELLHVFTLVQRTFCMAAIMT